MPKIPLDNSGRTWECLSCHVTFFIPENNLKNQRLIGCPSCTKGNWKLTSFSNLFSAPLTPPLSPFEIKPQETRKKRELNISSSLKKGVKNE